MSGPRLGKLASKSTRSPGPRQPSRSGRPAAEYRDQAVGDRRTVRQCGGFNGVATFDRGPVARLSAAGGAGLREAPGTGPQRLVSGPRVLPLCSLKASESDHPRLASVQKAQLRETHSARLPASAREDMRAALECGRKLDSEPGFVGRRGGRPTPPLRVEPSPALATRPRCW